MQRHADLDCEQPKVERVDATVIDRILRRVAIHGDGWQTDATPVDTFRKRLDTIRTYVCARDVMCRSSNPACTSWSTSTMIANRRTGRRQRFSYYGTGTISRERTELWLAYGPPEAVIEKIQAYLDAGCTTPVLRFVAPNLHDQLQRCIAEVLPLAHWLSTAYG